MGVTVIVTGVIVTVVKELAALLNPAVAFTNNVRFDVGTYRNPLGASIVNTEVPTTQPSCEGLAHSKISDESCRFQKERTACI